MKTGILIIVVLFTGIVIGTQYERIQARLGMTTDLPSAEVQSQEKKPLYWVAPMDKNYRRDGPGLSPMGMELVPVYEEASSASEGVVRISPAVVNNLGVKTVEVMRTDLYQVIAAPGIVQFNETNIHHLHSRVEGWIEVLNISSIGDTVKKGQTLYELYSPALVNAQEEFLAALRSGNANLINASRSRLVALGLNDRHIDRLEQRRKVDHRVKVMSEEEGVVKNLMVRQGMYIKPATDIASIAPLNSVWIIADVLERQAALVALNQDVEISLKAFPGETWQGKITYVYPEVNPLTRTLQVRVTLNNPDGRLKPNMYAGLKIRSAHLDNTLTLPRFAVIKAGQHQRVVKALGEGRFQSVIIETGLEALNADNGQPMIQVLSGLSEGERVVSSAQFLIDSESNIEAELARLQTAETNKEAEGTHQETVTAKGVINSVMADHAMLNITHEAIPHWGWPDMRMNFDVSADVAIAHLKSGQDITFTILKNPQGGIVITDISEIGDPPRVQKESADTSDRVDARQGHNYGEMQQNDSDSAEEMHHAH
jgi:Cu(I)/Ag(I) efflux system membrane fusion protein